MPLTSGETLAAAPSGKLVKNEIQAVISATKAMRALPEPVTSERSPPRY